ncbi:MAG: Flp family type IVb pilin [Syntrophobacter sp.]
MKEMLTRFIKDEEGVTMIEYAIIAALIAVISIATIGPLGTKVAALWTDIASHIP